MIQFRVCASESQMNWSTDVYDIHVIVYWTSTFTCTCMYLLSSFSSFSASMSSERTKNIIHIHITTSYKLHDRWIAHLQLAQVHCLPFWLIIIASHNIRVEYHKYNTYIYIYTIYISAQFSANMWDEEALQGEGNMSEYQYTRKDNFLSVRRDKHVCSTVNYATQTYV